MRLIRALDGFLSLCDRGFLIAANGCLAVMLAGNLAHIVYRNVTGSSFALVWPWTMVLFVWVNFIGFYVLYRRSKDVTVDYFVRRLQPTYRQAADLFVISVTVAVMAVMLVAAPYRLASQAGIIEIVGLPRVVLSVPFFASCLLILLDCFVRACFVIRPGQNWAKQSGARPFDDPSDGRSAEAPTMRAARAE